MALRTRTTLATAGVLLLGAGLLTAAPARAAATTTIAVDFTSPIAPSPAGNFGVTFSTFGVDGGPTATHPADIAALANLAPGSIRVHLKPDANGNIVTGADSGDTSISGDVWLDTIEQIGAQPTVIVNLDQADALAVLNYVNATGHTVQRFILGNEFDANSKSDVSAADYVTKFRQIAAAMRAVTPGLEIGGPAPAYFEDGRLHDIITGIVTNATGTQRASFIDYHAYGSGAGVNATIAESTRYATQIQQLRTWIGDASVGIQVGEFNMNWGDESQNNTHFASVWVANALGTIITNNARGLIYADKNNAMGLIGPGGTPKASYIGMEMFTGRPGGIRHFGTEVVQSSTSDSAVYAYASRNADNVVVVNTGDATTADLALTGIATGNADVWQSAGDIASIHTPVKTATVTITGGHATASLPAMSITTFVVTGTAGETATPAVLPAFSDAKWVKQGTATTTATTATLTTAAQTFSAGSVYYSDAVPSNGLGASFDATIGGGTGGDGMTLALLDPASTARVGGIGGGLGYSGLTGAAVALDTFDNATNTAGNLMGIATSATGSTFAYVTSTTAVPALRATHHYEVGVASGTMTVRVDGVVTLSAAVTLPSQVIVAFTAGTGGSADTHQVGNVVVTTGTPIPGFGDAGWVLYGTATKTAASATLTAAGQQFAAGSVVYGAAKASEGLVASFDAYLGGGTGGDGMTMVLLDPASTARVGAAGGGLGYGGLTGVAITFDTHQNGTDPSGNFVGVATAGTGDVISYAATAAAIASLRSATHHFVVRVQQGHVLVAMDGVSILDATVTLPGSVLVGFTGGTGGDTDTHRISGVVLTTR
ncbi:MAG: hypothetical protein HOV77_14790 [Hamadaea sp.]|uniref:hypothetical protein n=1 Tax=Hamadaea sp. TaxID=2024425 RepID=UPI0017B8A0BD|nr:hypothetical protein [Hamadaea sp.]NUT20449.1 hypothetical protein [Hamadaea sp.]